MKILLACEESQTVCKAFRAKGHNAFSCDILPCSGGHPEWHLHGFLEDHIKWLEWDMIIAFPPCTHLAVSGAKHFGKKKADGRQEYAIAFFMMIANQPCKRIAIENPIGIMNTIYRKPDQIIHPYFFGDEYQKSTCLWLKGLPKLFHAKQTDLFNDRVTHVGTGEILTAKSGKKIPKWYSDAAGKPEIRSKTFPGIAAAMADQWG
jgi:hypothetical protein